jgi:uncharacterized damage-inducible protein DinB/RimJ/RimL family protein N-acetyltransferase
MSLEGREVPTNTLAHHFATMAYNTAWANHRLLKAVSQLSQEEFVARRTSFFPSLKATLNHNVTVDWYYVDALEHGIRGRPPNPEARSFFDPEEPFDTCLELADAQRAVDRRLVDLCVGLTDERLAARIGVTRRTGIVHETVTRLLSHLFQHQIHHRGQAHAMLAGTSATPPQLDEFFCAGEAPLRQHDLEELGYSESMIWSSRPNHPQTWPHVELREVVDSDFAIFVEHQSDPVSSHMAAFGSRDPDSSALMARWRSGLSDGSTTLRAVVHEGNVVGCVASFLHEGRVEVTYWIARSHWGRGIATSALQGLLDVVRGRPVYASAALDNVGSLRVLQKCGFWICGSGKAFAEARGVEIDEVFFERT